MRALKYIFISYLLTLIVSYSISAQGPGKSFNPTPADSSFEVMVFTNEVNWDNPAGTILNDVWIGIHPEYLIKIYSGYAITSIEIPSPLEYRKTYFWKVDAIDQTGTSEGDLWLYTTTNLISPVLHFFIDSFSTGTTNWIITNEGGDCVWDTININNSNYDLPVTASGIVLSADGSKCGLGTSTISTATLVNPIDLDFSTEAFMLFDNDLFITDSLDGAFIEYSDDDGKSWTTIWQRPGISYRKSQEFIDLTNLYFGVPFLLRFRTIQNGSDSWWAIDNLFIWGSDILSPIPPPSNLIAIGYTNQNLDSVCG